jgi:valyl-tRNA synthetase
MPFVTEYIWGLAGFEGKLIVGTWPTMEAASVPAEFEKLRLLVSDARRLRQENGVEAAKKVEFVVTNAQKADWMDRLVNGTITIVDTIPEGYAVTPSGAATIGLNLAGAVDLEKEKAKLAKELEEIEKYISSTEAKLANEEFTSKAPEKVVQGMKDKLEEAKAKRDAIKSRI